MTSFLTKHMHPQRLSKLLLASCLTVGFLLSGNAWAMSKADVKLIIIEEANASRIVPPALALAVAKVESNFNPRAESDVGARGVMQIMPATALSEFGVSKDRLWDARTNVRLGVRYLAKLYKQYGRRWDAALSHYNGGTLKGFAYTARPHDYTRSYVRSVQSWNVRFEREQIFGNLVASSSRFKDTPRASRSSSIDVADNGYWLYENPRVGKNWRDYLKDADRYLSPETVKAPSYNGNYESAGQNNWSRHLNKAKQRFRQRMQQHRQIQKDRKQYWQGRFSSLTNGDTFFAG